MNPELLKTLLPLFLGLVKDFYIQHNRMPSLQEAELQLNNDLTKFIMIGDKWLTEHPQQESPNDSLKTTGSSSSAGFTNQ